MSEPLPDISVPDSASRFNNPAGAGFVVWFAALRASINVSMAEVLNRAKALTLTTITSEIERRGLVTAADPRLSVEAASDESFFTITDEDGYPTFLDVGKDGGPTKRSSEMILRPLGLQADYDTGEDVLWGITDEDMFLTDLSVRKDGHFRQPTIDNIGSRLSADTFSQEFKDNLAQQVAVMVDESEVNPADSGYDVILLAGQSNMSGRGTPYDQRTDPPHARVWQWGSSGTYAGVMSQAVEPLAMVDSPSGIGPGLVFARFYAGIIPTNRQVLLVAAAQGGQRIVGGTWDPDTPGANATNAISRANAAIAANPNSRIVGILWVQGESDGDADVTAEQYRTKFDTLFGRFRTEITGAANVPIVVGGMVPEYLGTGSRTAIDGVHRATPSRFTFSAYAPGVSNGNLGDGNHYNAIGVRKLGRAMFDAYLTARTRTTTTP